MRFTNKRNLETQSQSNHIEVIDLRKQQDLQQEHDRLQEDLEYHRIQMNFNTRLDQIILQTKVKFLKKSKRNVKICSLKIFLTQKHSNLLKFLKIAFN